MDWIIVDTTGAYAPGEGTPIPAELLGETEVEREDYQPNLFSLNQNYPNPFNPSTDISFNLEKDGFTTLNVFNARGEIVSTLVEGNLTKGMHRITFDASDLTSGIYFYQLTANGLAETKKMMLMQ